MDSQNIDRIIREKLDSSDNRYDAQANEARERIWDRIQEKPRRKIPLLLVTLAAACAALLLVSSVLTVSLVRARKTTSLQAQTINQLKADPGVKSPAVQDNSNDGNMVTAARTDTVFVVKEKIVTIPATVVQAPADTVYIRQIVYREKEEEPVNNPAPKVNSPREEASSAKSTEILISNGNKPVKDKGRKFRIRFGGENEQTNNGNLALTTRY